MKLKKFMKKRKRIIHKYIDKTRKNKKRNRKS